MKKVIAAGLLSITFALSCADKKENREEFKEAHDKSSMVNKSAESAVENSEPVDAADSSKFKIDTTQKPTNYKSTTPNTKVGGAR